MPQHRITQTGANATPPGDFGSILRLRRNFASGLLHGGVAFPGRSRVASLGLLTSWRSRYLPQLEQADYIVWSSSTPVAWHNHPRLGWTVIPADLIPSSDGMTKRHRNLVIAALQAVLPDVAPPDRPLRWGGADHPPWQSGPTNFDGRADDNWCGENTSDGRMDGMTCSREYRHNGWHEAWNEYNSDEGDPLNYRDNPVLAWAPDRSITWRRDDS